MRRISGHSSSAAVAASIAILLLAFALRVYHLDFQASLSDDALGLVLARRNPLDLFSITATEPFPPTFYVTLSLWVKAAGNSEFAGRFYSLMFSLLAVAAMYLAGRKLLGVRGAAVAAFFLAINPFDIFFAQEVRMYTMVLLFSLVSSILAYDLMVQRHKRWIGYGVASVLAAMTHAFALFVLFAQDVAALAVGPREGKWLRGWAVSQLSVVAAFAIWIGLVATKLRAYNNALVSSQPLPVLFWRTVSAFGLGFHPATGLSLAAPIVLAVLAGLGLLWLAGQPGARRPFLFLLSYLAVPFITVWLISLARPIFYERYMAIALPPLLLASAAGVLALEQGLLWAGAALRRSAFQALAGLAVLAVAVSTGSQLGGYYRTVVYATSDQMRALARYVTSVASPLVVVNVPANDPLYGYYLPPGTAIASTLDLSPGGAELARLSSGHDNVWFLPFGSSDHQQQSMDWLARNDFPAGSRWFGNAQVLAFAPPDAGASHPLPVPAGAVFGGQISLQGAVGTTSISAGEPVAVTLTWQAKAKPAADYSVFVHLLDASGATVAQHDGWPAAGARPTSSWQAGESIEDRHGLLTATTLSPGTYRLEVGLYDAAGKRLSLANGASSLVIGEVTATGR